MMNKQTWLKAIFSPTGGCRSIADAIATDMPAVRELDLSFPIAAQTVAADTALLVVVPVYGGRVPAPAVERLRLLHGQGGPAVAVVVYGNRAYEDALLELCDTLRESGFRVVGAAAFIAEHSIVRRVAAGRPDAVDKQIAVDFGRAVLSKLAQPADHWCAEPTVPGNKPYRERPVMPVAPQANDDCGHCGSCASMCPVGAIPLDDPQTTDAETCILCMRCIEICPCDARALPEALLKGMGERLAQCGALTPKQPEIYL